MAVPIRERPTRLSTSAQRRLCGPGTALLRPPAFDWPTRPPCYAEHPTLSKAKTAGLALHQCRGTTRRRSEQRMRPSQGRDRRRHAQEVKADSVRCSGVSRQTHGTRHHTEADGPTVGRLIAVCLQVGDGPCSSTGRAVGAHCRSAQAGHVQGVDTTQSAVGSGRWAGLHQHSLSGGGTVLPVTIHCARPPVRTGTACRAGLRSIGRGPHKSATDCAWPLQHLANGLQRSRAS